MSDVIGRLIELGVSRRDLDRCIDEQGFGIKNRALMVLVVRVVREQWGSEDDQ